MKVRLLSSALTMLNATELKNGTAFLHYGKPFQVIKYSLIKMGRGGAVVKVTARNLETGSIEEISYSSNVAVDEVNTAKRQLQFLYKDATNAVFIDPKTYEQVEVLLKIVGDSLVYLKEGQLATVLFWDEKPLSVELTPKVELTVSECDPGVKGNSATNIYKPAVLENGLQAKVPLFINVGDKIRVDTRTGEYLERVR
ncbi:MAG TPA: elongation factor P [Patescibacteria group bacterium]|nr:elongation factor P [Patescibacteria group bacterium]